MNERRHRINEDEIPSTKRALYIYLADQADYPTDDTDNIMGGLKLFHRVLRGVQGNPAYPDEFNEPYNPTTLTNYLELAASTHPELRAMVPFSTRGMGGGPGSLAHLPQARGPAKPQEAQ